MFVLLTDLWFVKLLRVTWFQRGLLGGWTLSEGRLPCVLADDRTPRWCLTVWPPLVHNTVAVFPGRGKMERGRQGEARRSYSASYGFAFALVQCYFPCVLFFMEVETYPGLKKNGTQTVLRDGERSFWKSVCNQKYCNWMLLENTVCCSGSLIL